MLVYFDAFSFEARGAPLRPPAARPRRGGGVFARITSQFPSTTTVAHDDDPHRAPVGEHGLYEWFVLEPSSIA